MLLLSVLCFLKAVWADSQIVLNVIPFGKSVVLEEGTDLNLTCQVKSPGRAAERYDLAWKLPTRSNANGDRISIYEIDDQLTITIHTLQEDDSGIYVCELQNKGIIRTRKISVFIRSKKCGKHFFDCGNHECVPKHYVCDGYVDCPSGFDESFKHCGPDACHGKILCDGRCIPKEFCCDPAVDVNCTVNYVMPCCTGFLHQEINPIPCSATVDCHLGRFIGFGNSVIYIVASCAVVVIIVSAFVMFLACKICSQRSEELNRLSRISNSELERQLSMHQRELEAIENDAIFDDTELDPNPFLAQEQAEDFLLLDYEDPLMEQYGPKPPPYTEHAIGIPPPPPYESVLDIPSAIKDDEEDNSQADTTSPAEDISTEVILTIEDTSLVESTSPAENTSSAEVILPIDETPVESLSQSENIHSADVILPIDTSPIESISHAENISSAVLPEE